MCNSLQQPTIKNPDALYEALINSLTSAVRAGLSIKGLTLSLEDCEFLRESKHYKNEYLITVYGKIKISDKF